MWNKLSMYDRAKVIKLGIDSGVTDLNHIKRAYNTYAEGGYMDWLNAVKQWRPGINEDIDAAEPTYDYEGFFFDNPEYAWKMLQGDPEAHFTDKYKRPNHPTFSDESIYSTPETPGGKWHENYGGSGRWVYEPSDYTRQHIEETRRYLENSGEGYLDGMNVVFPNRYQKGGHMSPYSAGAMVDAIYEGAKNVESLGKPSHGYDFTQSEEWADAHGYYPDERGHRDDRVKKPSHPTHPSRGKWNGMNEFQLTDRGMEDPNYVRFGMADGGQDPQAVLTHDGAIVLPEFTVTPNGNYIHNSYDNLNISYSKGGRVNRFDDGGPKLSVPYSTEDRMSYLGENDPIEAFKNTDFSTALPDNLPEWFDINNYKLVTYDDNNQKWVKKGPEVTAQEAANASTVFDNNRQGSYDPSKRYQTALDVNADEFDILNRRIPAFRAAKQQEQLDSFNDVTLPDLEVSATYPVDNNKLSVPNTDASEYTTREPHMIAPIGYGNPSDYTTSHMEHENRVKAADELVRETAAFEKPLNYLSPGQWFGAGIDYLQGETDDFWGSIYHGNSGWMPDSFAKAYPRMSAALNFVGDIAIPYGVSKAGANLYNYTMPRAKGLVKGYHGSPTDFPIEEFHTGTTNDIGLHMGVGKRGKAIASEMAGNNGVVKEMWVEKPTMETVDLGANGIDLLSNDILYRKGIDYDIAGNNSFERGLIEKQGAKVTETNGQYGRKMTLDRDVTVPLLDETWPDIPTEARFEVRDLVNEYNSKGLNLRKNPNKLMYSPDEMASMADINKRAADILSRNGKRVIKYNNNNALEGGGGSSLIVTTPEAFHYPSLMSESGFTLPSLNLDLKRALGGKVRRKKK